MASRIIDDTKKTCPVTTGSIRELALEATYELEHLFDQVLRLEADQNDLEQMYSFKVLATSAIRRGNELNAMLMQVVDEGGLDRPCDGEWHRLVRGFVPAALAGAKQ